MKRSLTWSTSSTGRHCEREKAEVKKGEESVQRVLAAVRNCTNPFTVAHMNRFYCLASGAPVPMGVEIDVLRTEALGKAAKADFIGHPQSGELGRFFDHIKKKKLTTKETCDKMVTLTTSQGKVIMCSNTRDLLRFNFCIVVLPITFTLQSDPVFFTCRTINNRKFI